MNRKTIGAIALTSALAMMGCVSVDAVRQQVNSSDKNEVAAGEKKIMTIVENRNNFISPETIEEYISLLKSNDLRLELMVDPRYSRGSRTIAENALKGVSFKDEDEAVTFITKNAAAQGKNEYTKQMFAKALDKISSAEALERVYNTSGLASKLRVSVGKKLVQVSNCEKILCDIIDDTWYSEEDRKSAMSRINNKEWLINRYKSCKKNGYVADYWEWKVIFSKISETEIEKIIGQEKVQWALKNDITKLTDDAQYFALFKEAVKTADDAKKKSLFERACSMSKEDILIEFLSMYPDRAGRVAEKRGSNVKSSKLAEIILDHTTGLMLEGKYEGWDRVPGLDDVVLGAVLALDDAARAKYLKKADANLAIAMKDKDILVIERYYVGMPVLDYILRSFEDKLVWTTKDRISMPIGAADMKTDITDKDWRKEWKVKCLIFGSKDRSKLFKVKGTMDGLVQFLKKYVDKSATIQDVTVEDGWWVALDDAHGLKVALNDNNGALNVYRQ